MTKPIIAFVPGLWEGPTVFDNVASILQSHGYTTISIPLESTGKTSADKSSLHADVRGIRVVVKRLIEERREIVLVLHSAGGLLGSQAIEGLGKEARSRDGKEGGVSKLVFLTAGLLPEGMMHSPDLPFYEIEGGRMYCKDPASILFNDLLPSEAEKWSKVLSYQPAIGWYDICTYAGWKHVPSVYLTCENDQAIPLALQQDLAKLAGSEIETCSAGHMVMLSQPGRVVEIVRKATGESL